MARALAIFAEKHRKQQQVLCLPPATGELPENGGVVVASPASPTRKYIEHAGHVYQQTVIRKYCIDAQNFDDSSSTASNNSDSPSDSAKSNRRPSADAASTLASKIAVGSDDLYELLELGDKRWHATADDIKKSFRRISLLYHPDKIAHLGEEARQNSEDHFKAVMKAYDILSDKKKRAAYDSIDDVDDSIPSERDATASLERFYEKFGACFALNARWSVSDRVPELGSDDTDLETVNKFYDFWYSFKSWRDFSFDLEYDTDQAECREEKRWMERQNGKHVRSRKLEESARIRRLVDLAHKHDPRLQREKEAVKAKKDAKKQEKKRLAEQQAQAERERREREEAEAERRAAEQKEKRNAERKRKENARQIMRKARQKLRALSRGLNLISSERGMFVVEKMCLEGSPESIEAVTSLLGGLELNQESSTEKGLTILEQAALNPRDALSPDDLNDEETNRIGTTHHNSESHVEKGAEEDSTDSPGMSGHSNTPQEGRSAQSASDHEPNWTADELSLLSKGVAKFPGGTRDRWNKLADFIATKTADEVLRKVNESRASKIKPQTQTVLSQKQEDAKAFERFQEKKKGKPITAQPKSKAEAVKSPTASIPSQPPNKLQFTPREQALFEAALKKHPASDGSRWKKVSTAVGRSPDECQQRFKELIAFFQAKKQSK